MWLVWVVIPLILFGIIGMQELFAEEIPSLDRGHHYRIALTDDEDNFLYTMPLGKESFFTFYSVSYNNKGESLYH